MSSALASPAQIPTRVGYFKAEYTGYEYFINEPIDFKTATGYLSSVGNIVFFNTYANARSALVGGVNPPGTALTTGAFLRDMGKTIHIEVYNSANRVSQRVATLTKVQEYVKPGQTTEGVTGLPLSAPAVASTPKGYRTGYVVTWTANPDASTGVPVGVTRTGY